MCVTCTLLFFTLYLVDTVTFTPKGFIKPKINTKS